MDKSSEQQKGIVAWWSRNSVAANLLMVMALVFGVIGFSKLEQEVFPSADFNGASVSISWPGASPTDVEEQIVTRLEEVLADLDGCNTEFSFAQPVSASRLIPSRLIPFGVADLETLIEEQEL